MLQFMLDDVLNNLNDIVSQKADQKGILKKKIVTCGYTSYQMGDPLRMGRVLINLLNNAIKFTEKGQILKKIIAAEHSPEKGLFRFSVSDTGIGMSQEQVSKLFSILQPG